MKQIFSHGFGFGGPEAIGLMILGATVGAVAGGAGGDGGAFQPGLCAGAGALMLPAVLGAPWSRLRRVRKWVLARASRLA